MHNKRMQLDKVPTTRVIGGWGESPLRSGTLASKISASVYGSFFAAHRKFSGVRFHDFINGIADIGEEYGIH